MHFYFKEEILPYGDEQIFYRLVKRLKCMSWQRCAKLAWIECVSHEVAAFHGQKTSMSKKIGTHRKVDRVKVGEEEGDFVCDIWRKKNWKSISEEFHIFSVLFLKLSKRAWSYTMIESVFDILHYEVVKYLLGDEKTPQQNNNKNLSTIEYIGFSTGYRLTERLTREWPRFRFKDDLETMKFICTDFWTSIYKKQIDNLRTNHKGVYVLQDNAFRYLVNISNSSQYLEEAPKFVAYTCGLVRGSLANLGINSTVTAEVQNMPSCKFHIQVNPSSA